jgi:hypothetical protein
LGPGDDNQRKGEGLPFGKQTARLNRIETIALGYCVWTVRQQSQMDVYRTELCIPEKKWSRRQQQTFWNFLKTTNNVDAGPDFRPFERKESI